MNVKKAAAFFRCQSWSCQWLVGVLQSSSGHPACRGAREQCSQAIPLPAPTLPAAEHADLSLCSIQKPTYHKCVVFTNFYCTSIQLTVLLHRDCIEYATIIKQKKKGGGGGEGSGYLVLIHHMQIPAVFCRPTTKHTLLPRADEKASCWWKWLIHKIFAAKARTRNEGFRLLTTKISHSFTSKYRKGLCIYRKPPQKWLLAEKWDQNSRSCYQAGQRCTKQSSNEQQARKKSYYLAAWSSQSKR